MSDTRWIGWLLLATSFALLGCHAGYTITYSYEVGAIATIRTLNSAEAQYRATYDRYAGALQELGPPTEGKPNAAAADLISATVASGETRGYKYTLTTTPTGYTIYANPVAFGKTGSRTFFSDQTEKIYQHFGPEPATASDLELN